MNNLYGFSAENFVGQLPAVLYDDPQMNALARAIAETLVAVLGKLPLVEIYTRIDALPEELLDILARDFSIDWYNYSYPIEAKRNLIKTNYYVHRHLGTVGAVKSAVLSVYPHSIVEEWFQYDGDPYHFRIVLESGRPFVPVSNTEVLREAYLYKSMRSHLDGIIYRASHVLTVRTGYGWLTYWGRICGTFPQTAQKGSIERFSVTVRTNAGGIAYASPRTGEMQSGAYPNPSTEGRVYPHTIGISGDAGGIAYRTPYTGEIEAGAFPQASQVGMVSDGIIAVEAGAASTVYQNPATGEIASGTFPAAAVQGQIFSASIGTEADSGAASYGGRVCGSSLDSLF